MKKEKILKVLEKHKEYFENVGYVDVAFSTKGDCFFYEYDEEHDMYPTFVKISSAEELDQIIEENIATEFCVNLECAMEDMMYEMEGTRREEIEVDPQPVVSALDRKILIKAFAAFIGSVESVHDKLQLYKKWVGEMEKQTEKS